MKKRNPEAEKAYYAANRDAIISYQKQYQKQL